MKAILLTLVASCTLLQAEDVTLEWVPGGFSMKQGYYKPQRAQLSSEKPSQVTKTPADISAAVYAILSFGAANEEKKVAVLIDEPAPDKSRIWIDANGNGDLTDDPAPTWEPRTNTSGSTTTTTWSGGATVPVKFGGQERPLGIKMYRFDKNDPRRAGFKSVMFYYRDFGLAGKVTLNGKTYTAMVGDETARGDFVGSSDARFSIDLNDDGKFDSRSESFATTEPFNIGGTTYELAGLKPGGVTFQIVKSEKTVAEKKVPVAVKPGAKVTAFEEKTTDGKIIRFPEDYKGKLVMLDFWATWCGPCVAEVPNLSKVHRELQARGFEVLGVSLDSEQTLPRLKQFTEEKGMTWPQIADGKGWEAKLAGLYGVRAIPACFLVDGTTGQLVATANELRGESLRPTVERALANLGKAPVTGTTPVEPKTSVEPKAAATEPNPDPLAKKARALQEKGELMTAEKFTEALKQPAPSSIALPPPGTQPLRAREIADRAAAAHVRAGWIYQCTKCSNWHSNLAGGYAIARDTIVTAHHVLDAPATMKPGTGCPVIVRKGDEIIPIRGIIAADESSDTIIVRVGVNDLRPLSLVGDVRTGDTVYCLSDPRGVSSYFSTGIVNRHYTREKGSADDPRDQRLHVSTDWAQGSSGAAVLDECGNAIGHVSKIRTLYGAKQPDTSTAPSVMSLHEAVPASCVLRLLEQKSAGK